MRIAPPAPQAMGPLRHPTVRRRLHRCLSLFLGEGSSGPADSGGPSPPVAGVDGSAVCGPGELSEPEFASVLPGSNLFPESMTSAGYQSAGAAAADGGANSSLLGAGVKSYVISAIGAGGGLSGSVLGAGVKAYAVRSACSSNRNVIVTGSPGGGGDAADTADTANVLRSRSTGTEYTVYVGFRLR